jgi:hypothetical protein
MSAPRSAKTLGALPPIPGTRREAGRQAIPLPANLPRAYFNGAPSRVRCAGRDKPSPALDGTGIAAGLRPTSARPDARAHCTPFNPLPTPGEPRP